MRGSFETIDSENHLQLVFNVMQFNTFSCFIFQNDSLRFQEQFIQLESEVVVVGFLPSNT